MVCSLFRHKCGIAKLSAACYNTIGAVVQLVGTTCLFYESLDTASETALNGAHQAEKQFMALPNIWWKQHLAACMPE